jgi:hypothetical protein
MHANTPSTAGKLADDVLSFVLVARLNSTRRKSAAGLLSRMWGEPEHPFQ